MPTLKEAVVKNEGEVTKMLDFEINRGEVFTVNLEGLPNSNSHVQSKTRPMLVLQNDTGNKFAPTVIGALITAKDKKNYPMHQDIYLDKPSTILFEQIITVDKERLIRKMGVLNCGQRIEAEKKLSFSLGISQFSILDIEKVTVQKKIEEVTKEGRKAYFIVKVRIEGTNDREVIVPYNDIEDFILDSYDLADVEQEFNSLRGLKVLGKNMYRVL